MDKTFLDMPSGFQERRRPHPNENFAPGNRISIVFFEFHEGYFFKCQKNGQIQVLFFLRKNGGSNFFLSFLLFLTKVLVTVG